VLGLGYRRPKPDQNTWRRPLPPLALAASAPKFTWHLEHSQLLFGRQRLPILDNRYTVNTVAMSNATKTPKPAAGRSAIDDVVAREYTIHMHKRVRSV
jgi:hypothetical protein